MTDTPPRRAAGATLLHEKKPGNLEREVRQEFGDVEAGFKAADLVREARRIAEDLPRGFERERERRRRRTPEVMRRDRVRRLRRPLHRRGGQLARPRQFLDRAILKAG